MECVAGIIIDGADMAIRIIECLFHMERYPEFQTYWQDANQLPNLDAGYGLAAYIQKIATGRGCVLESASRIELLILPPMAQYLMDYRYSIFVMFVNA